MAATISTPHYLLDQARRRFTPSINNFPGMGLVERRLRNTEFPERTLAEPPPGSGLKAAVGDAGLPVIGHLIEMLRGGPGLSDVPVRDQGPHRLRGLAGACRPSRRWGRTPRRSSTPTATRTTPSRAGSR